jgi:hypothetical protein
LVAPNRVAVRVESQELYLCSAPVDEGEPLASRGILLQVVSNHRRQTIERASHVGGLRTQPNALPGIDTQHGGRLKRSTI